MEWQIWDEGLYLYSVYTSEEADEHKAVGFQVKALELV
jgi:hypothetical protein